MKTRPLGNTGIQVSEICLGAMNLGMPDWGIDQGASVKVIDAYLESGGNFIDTADAYGGGASEEIFADVLPMNDDTREKVILQSKAGIKQGEFDFSKEHILEAVDGSLRRLKTSYLDVLLLHRPDALVEPDRD